MISDTMKPIDTAFQILGLHSAYDYYWNESYSFAGERHDFWEIVFVLSGEVEATEDDRIYNLKADDMLIHAPMEFHKIRSVPRTTPRLYILTFSANGHLPDLLKEGVFRLSQDERETYQTIFADAFRHYNGQAQDPYHGQLCGLELSTFLIRLARNLSVDSRLSETRSAQEYHKVVLAMSDGLYDNLTLSALSEQCHISISYIKALFARHSGMSPKSYYIKMRCNEAIRLLQSGMSISEVSEIMNFSSPNYFSVFIKNQLGLPPAEYMKRNK